MKSRFSPLTASIAFIILTFVMAALMPGPRAAWTVSPVTSKYTQYHEAFEPVAP